MVQLANPREPVQKGLPLISQGSNRQSPDAFQTAQLGMGILMTNSSCLHSLFVSPEEIGDAYIQSVAIKKKKGKREKKKVWPQNLSNHKKVLGKISE